MKQNGNTNIPKIARRLPDKLQNKIECRGMKTEMKH